jgi:predicted outer membrane repeat protein
MPSKAIVTMALTNDQDGLADPSSCAPSVTSSGLNCTIRSAVQYCVDTDARCHIYLTPSSNINLTQGEMFYATDAFNVVIYGQGSTLTTGTGSRFIQLHSASRFEMWNISLTSFGSGDVDGGAIYLNDASGVIFSSVVFRRNRGNLGGVIYTSSVDAAVMEYCQFTENTASNNGGVVYADQDNEGWSISTSAFTDNTAEFLGGVVYANQNNDDWSFSTSTFTVL